MLNSCEMEAASPASAPVSPASAPASPASVPTHIAPSEALMALLALIATINAQKENVLETFNTQFAEVIRLADFILSMNWNRADIHTHFFYGKAGENYSKTESILVMEFKERAWALGKAAEKLFTQICLLPKWKSVDVEDLTPNQKDKKRKLRTNCICRMNMLLPELVAFDSQFQALQDEFIARRRELEASP
jgi:hypothetical protein